MSATPQPRGTTPAAAAATTVPLEPRVSGADQPRRLPLRFTGSAGDYFRIWIVNLCLTLLTLGVFSAWAKVRKKRYLYSHTVLDGTPFQYLGQPIPILKGRLIATVVFGAWYVGTHYVPELLPVVGTLLLVLAPWVMVRAAAFNARYSAFRNMTFEFKGGYWSAVKVLYGWAIVAILTLGFGFSWWQQRIKQYMVTRSSYGGVPGEFGATGWQFFKKYIVAILFMMGAVALFSAGAGALFATGGGKDVASFIIAFTVGIYAFYVFLFAYIQARIGNLVWNSTRLGPLAFGSTLRARSLLYLYVTNALAILGSLGLLIPWATIRMLKYRIANFSVTAEGDIGEFRGTNATTVQAAGAEVGDFFDFDMSI